MYTFGLRLASKASVWGSEKSSSRREPTDRPWLDKRQGRRRRERADACLKTSGLRWFRNRSRVRMNGNCRTWEEANATSLLDANARTSAGHHSRGLGWHPFLLTQRMLGPAPRHRQRVERGFIQKLNVTRHAHRNMQSRQTTTTMTK